eukprot:ctg_1683.g522
MSDEVYASLSALAAVQVQIEWEFERRWLRGALPEPHAALQRAERSDRCGVCYRRGQPRAAVARRQPLHGRTHGAVWRRGGGSGIYARGLGHALLAAGGRASRPFRLRGRGVVHPGARADAPLRAPGEAADVLFARGGERDAGGAGCVPRTGVSAVADARAQSARQRGVGGADRNGRCGSGKGGREGRGAAAAAVAGDDESTPWWRRYEAAVVGSAASAPHHPDAASNTAREQRITSRPGATPSQRSISSQRSRDASATRLVDAAYTRVLRDVLLDTARSETAQLHQLLRGLEWSDADSPQVHATIAGADDARTLAWSMLQRCELQTERYRRGEISASEYSRLNEDALETWLDAMSRRADDAAVEAMEEMPRELLAEVLYVCRVGEVLLMYQPRDGFRQWMHMPRPFSDGAETTELDACSSVVRDRGAQGRATTGVVPRADRRSAGPGQSAIRRRGPRLASLARHRATAVVGLSGRAAPPQTEHAEYSDTVSAAIAVHRDRRPDAADVAVGVAARRAAVARLYAARYAQQPTTPAGRGGTDRPGGGVWRGDRRRDHARAVACPRDRTGNINDSSSIRQVRRPTASTVDTAVATCMGSDDGKRSSHSRFPVASANTRSGYDIRSAIEADRWQHRQQSDGGCGGGSGAHYS